jgi:PAS domain S-box-containing protein
MTAYNFLKMNGMEIRVVKRTTAEPFVKSLPEKSYEQIQTWILENMVAIPCSIYCQVDNMKRKGELMKVTKKQRQRTSSRIQPSRIKNMGLQIRLAREQLEHVVSTNPAAIFLEKPDHDNLELSSAYVSESIVSVLGFEAENFIGESGTKFWESRVQADDLQRYLSEIPMLWKDGHHTFEFRFLHKDGTYRWIREEQKVTQRDVDGNPLEIVGYTSDMTERKRVEEELRVTRKQLEYVVASNPAVVYLAKPLPDFSDYYATYMSKSIASMTGFDPDVLVGSDSEAFWANRVHPEDLVRYRTDTPKLWKTGHQTFEYRFLHKDGTYRWIREEAKVIYDSAGNLMDIIGYWTDITERKRMEEALLRSERLAAVGETAAMVAHDLRNPLQGITGATDVLKKHLGNTADETTRKMLDVFDKNVAYSNKIITDLLDYSRSIRILPVETNLKSMIERSIQMVLKPNTVTVEDQTEDLRILLDPQIQRVFVNLIENAYDAMPNGGRLKISSKNLNGTVEVSFSDTGEGVAEEVMEKLWRGPITTKAKGLGLGLAISKRIIEAHDGTIRLERNLQKGTLIRVALPMQPRFGGE